MGVLKNHFAFSLGAICCVSSIEQTQHIAAYLKSYAFFNSPLMFHVEHVQRETLEGRSTEAKQKLLYYAHLVTLNLKANFKTNLSYQST